MPTLEQMRAWFKGDDVEGLPPHKKPRVISKRVLQEEGWCEQCRYSTPARWSHGTRAPVMTAYEWDGKGEDPNNPPILCEEHKKEWVEHWQERWDEYHAGLI
jgi:hypothetical protein